MVIFVSVQGQDGLSCNIFNTLFLVRQVKHSFLGQYILVLLIGSMDIQKFNRK